MRTREEILKIIDSLGGKADWKANLILAGVQTSLLLDIRDLLEKLTTKV